MTGKQNESISYQRCDPEGEPLPGTELKEVRLGRRCYHYMFSVCQHTSVHRGSVLISATFIMLSDQALCYGLSTCWFCYDK